METEPQKQERQIRDRLAAIYQTAKTQPGSGNQATAPNDVAITNHLHIECKTTKSTSIKLEHSWITRANKLALQFGVVAFVAVRFHEISNKDFFVVSDDAFYNFLLIEKQNEELITENRRLKQARVTKDAYEDQIK